MNENADGFAHVSEHNLAAIFDFYDIEWQYEPTTFVLDAKADGSLASAFAPDFYLPQFDLYIELTTLKQRHVTKKNKKLRLLKARYPQVNAKILYLRDYEKLIESHVHLVASLVLPAADQLAA